MKFWVSGQLKTFTLEIAAGYSQLWLSSPSFRTLEKFPFESSSEYIWLPNCICFKLFMQEIRRARSLAVANAGNSMAARMAMMAMTTSSSIKVKPPPMKGLTGQMDFFMVSFAAHSFDNHPHNKAKRRKDFHANYKRKAHFH